MPAEFVTTAPYFYEGKLVVTTYIPEKVSQDVCVVSERGVGRVYILDVDTGRATFKPVLLKNVKLTGVTGVRGRLLFSAEEKRSGALKEAEVEFPEVRRLAQNLLEIRLPQEGDLPLNPGSPYRIIFKRIAVFILLLILILFFCWIRKTKIGRAHV